MRILGIESSCDETAAAVIEISPSARSGRAARVRVLSNVVASQVKLHAKFGGVVPHLAKREHQKNLVPVLLRALRESAARDLGFKIYDSRARERFRRVIPKSKLLNLNSILERESDLLARMVKQVLPLPAPKVDAIAVTVGPGLAPALWVGVNFARALSYLWKKPIIPVNHLEGHIYTNLLASDQIGEHGEVDENIQVHQAKRFISLTTFTFPALCLIVSGGHTELVLMRRYGDYRVIGETLDDAAGEAFDKVAKMMGLGFPGGPVIAKLAEKGDARAFNFPRPMISAKNYDFSFSGLKTAVLYTLRDLPQKPNIKVKRDIVASFEQAVVDVLVAKTVRAAKQYRAKTAMIGGGVAANKKLRAALGAALAKQYPSASYLVPHPSLTGDNALMIALAGWFNRNKKTARWISIRAEANLRLDGR